MTAVLGPGLFYLSAALAVAGALGTVGSRSPIRSAMALLLTIVGIAGLYLTLSAQLLAAIQIMVYAGAVVVLFLFVIMLLGGASLTTREDPTLRTRAIAVSLFAVGVLVILILLFRGGIGGPHIFDRAHPEFGSVYALGRVMFTDGLVAFELIGVLLTAAIVGVMAVARTRHASKPDQIKEGDS